MAQQPSNKETPSSQEEKQSSADQTDKKKPNVPDDDNVASDRDETSPSQRSEKKARESQNEERREERAEQRRERREDQGQRREDRRDRRDDRSDDDRDRSDRRDDRSDRQRDQLNRRDDRSDRQRDQLNRRDDRFDRDDDRSDRRDDRSDRDSEEIELGASLRTNEQNQLIVSNLSDRGVLAGSGIRQGDVIMSVDNRNISSQAELNRWIRQADRGARLPVVVMRGGQRQTIYLEPGRRFGRGFGRRGPIGINFRSGPQGRLIISELARSGLLVGSGLRRGDVIVEVDNRPIVSQDEFTSVLYGYDGGRLPVVVLRDGRRETVYVTLHEERYGAHRPDDDRSYDSPDSRQAWLGVYLDPQYQDRAVVEAVQSDSPADQAGLRAGDSILRINGQRIQGPWHLSRLVGNMQPYEEIEIEVSRRMVRDFHAELAERPQRRGRVRYDDDLNLERRSYRGEIQVQPDENITEYEQ